MASGDRPGTPPWGQVLWHAGCYAVCAAAFAASQAAQLLPAMTLSMVAMAFVMAFNFMPLHETVHRSAFKTRLWNDVFMHVAGLLTLRPVRCAPACARGRAAAPPASQPAPVSRLSAAFLQALHYFYYHWAHHKFTGDPEKDSELIPSPLDMDVTTLPGYMLYISGLPFWFDAITSTVKHALGICPEHYLSAAKAKKEITFEARVYWCPPPAHPRCKAHEPHNPAIPAIWCLIGSCLLVLPAPLPPHCHLVCNSTKYSHKIYTQKVRTQHPHMYLCASTSWSCKLVLTVYPQKIRTQHAHMTPTPCDTLLNTT